MTAMTQSDLLALWGNLTESRLAELPRRMVSAGLPGDATDAMSAELAVALAGVAVALARWTPRPPIVDADEAAAVVDLLAAMADARMAETIAAWESRMGVAAARANTSLLDWNRGRSINQPLSERAAAAAIERQFQLQQADYDHVSFERRDDGSIIPRYTVKPSRD